MEDQNQTPKQNNKAIAGVAIFAIIAILGFVLNASKPETSSLKSNQNSQAIVTPTPTTESQPSLTNAEIADGTYESKGEYVSPGGKESIDVKITIKNGIIDTAEVTPNATNPKSVKFQGIFKDNFKTQVIGKKISEIKLDKVSGSSLTSKGFNDAIQKIVTENS